MTSTADTLRTETNNAEKAQRAPRRPQETNQLSTLLPAARRLDWRFLLADPVLGNVVAIEPVAQSLADPLQLFSRSLTILSLPRNDEARWREAADVVVACNPSRTTVNQAAALAKPGGYIYFESHGFAHYFKRLRRPGSGIGRLRAAPWRPAAYVSLLKSLGFINIQAHWHYPNFESCKMMIPLDNTTAAHLALDRGGRGLQARLRTTFGRALVSSRLLPLVVPCFSIVAQWEISS